jgi:MFS family permease
VKNTYENLGQNMTLGILNGVFFNLAIAFISGATIIPLFISGLTNSNIIIGAFSSLEAFGWHFPQFFAGALIAGRPLVLGYYNRISIVRAITFASAISFIFIIKNSNHSLLLVSFGVLFTVFSLASGLAGISFMEIVGKMIPASKRGTFFGMRMFFGGLLAALSAPLVKKIIGSFSFPVNFGYVFIISLVAVIIGLSCFALIKERPLPLEKSKPDFKTNLSGGLKLLRNDSNIRHLVIARLLSNAILLASPFYVIMAHKMLGISRALAATYLSFEMVGYLGLNFLWAWLSNRVSNKRLLEISTICALVPPILALVSLVKNPGYFIFGLTFFFNGAVLSGTSMGYTNYLLEIAPEDSRPISVGLVHTIIAPTVFLSSIGGLILEISNFWVLFGITLILLIISYLYITYLKEPAR